MDLLELMKERYSVRNFSDKKVEQEKIDRILEAAKAAPTACKPTEQAKKNGAYVDSSSENCWWWLRSPGYDQGFAAIVDYGGSFSYGGDGVGDDSGCVRPALWINLDS